MIPSRAVEPSAPLINARAETAATKPSFRDPLRKQRCLVPADGSYEWRRASRQKQAFCFEVGDSAIFAFAGPWDRWRGADGTIVESCTILTTTPNALLAHVHDRMPVILPPESYHAWLDPDMHNAASALAMLKPFDSTLMRRHAVSAKVNLVVNDGPECSALVELPATMPSLFD